MNRNNTTNPYRQTSKQLIAAVLLTLTCLGAPPITAIEMLDRVIVIVDDAVITQSELNDRTKEVLQRMQQAKMQIPEMSMLKEQLIKQLITERLQLNAARRYGLNIADADVNEAMKNIRAEQGWTQKAFEAHLKQEGQTLNEFKEMLRRDITLNQVSRGAVFARIRISEQEVDNFLQSADAQFWISAEYQLGHILVSLPQSPDTKTLEAAKKKADKLYEQIREGANFEQLAITHSAGPAALKGGDLGWRKTSSLPTLFAEHAPKLVVGEVAKPIRSQAGFHILKLNGKRGDTQQTVQQTKARHILIKTSEIVDEQTAQRKLEKILNELEQGADFVDLARQHSDDIATKLNGGDLGWSQPGTLVKEFEQVMGQTDIGKTSQPFKTSFGWHIVNVIDRRNEDITQELRRKKAHNILASRRFEDEVQLWIQELRDNAFIEKKI